MISAAPGLRPVAVFEEMLRRHPELGPGNREGRACAVIFDQSESLPSMSIEGTVQSGCQSLPTIWETWDKADRRGRIL
jgi:hypothetical protein